MRLTGTAGVLAVLTLVSIQFVRICEQNIAMSNSLSAIRRDVQTLNREKAVEERAVRRLRDPRGAIPAIHERLHLVSPNETIIYIKPARPPAP